MLLPRSAALRGSIRSFTLKRATAQARGSLRGIGRRTYASDHGAKPSSDLPWMIGSIAVTVPATVWLLQQAPQKSDHGHGHDEHAAEDKHEEEAPAEESKEEEEPAKAEDAGKEEDAKEGGEGDKEDKEESKDEGDDTPKEEGKEDAAKSDENADDSEKKGKKEKKESKD